MTDAAAVAAELAALLPALEPALARDNGHGGASGFAPGSLVNADVLDVMITLQREVPAAYAEVCALAGERFTRGDAPGWCPERLSALLRGFPRLADRARTLGAVGAPDAVLGSLRGWLRQAKKALGLISGERRLAGWFCPLCPDPVELWASGEESALRRPGGRAGLVAVSALRVFCPGCGASWGAREWTMLRRLCEDQHPAGG